MKNKNRHIIGFAGRARSGKTHLSELLSKESNAKIFTIAKYLKLLCCEILKLDNIGELNRLKNYRKRKIEEAQKRVNRYTAIMNKYEIL